MSENTSDRSNANKSYRDKKLRTGILMLIAVIISLLLLNAIYEVIAPLFESQYRFKSEFIGVYRTWFVVPVTLLYSFFLFRQQKRDSLSDFFIVILTLTYFLPGNILYIYGNWSTTYYFFIQLSYFCLCSLNEISPHRLKITGGKKVITKATTKKSLYAISSIIAISVILITLIYNDLNITLDLEDVYDLRREWSQSRMPNIFNYYLPFAARITPILLVISLKDKQITLSALLIFTQLLLFSFGGSKYSLFALILALLIGLTEVKITGRRIIFLYVILLLLCAIECYTSKGSLPLLSIYTIRRMSFVPNQIGFYYFDFFKNTDYLYYSESFLSAFLDYPYRMSFPHVIGSYAFDLPSMGANTGLFPEGYSQIGWLSIPIYSILYLIAFMVYANCSLGFNWTKYFQAPILGVLLYALSFQDGSFFSVLLTQGFILSLLTMYLLSKSIKSNHNHGSGEKTILRY